MAHKQTDVLDSGPLLDKIESSGGLATLLGGSDQRERAKLRKAIERARQDGTVNVYAGDRLSIALFGEPGTSVWGDDFWVNSPLLELDDLPD